MEMRKLISATAAAISAVAILATLGALAQQPAKVDQAGAGRAAARPDPAIIDKYVAATFKGASVEWLKRIEQDETQKVCSQYRNELPTALFTEVLVREKAAVVLPADGNVLGDWKAGERVAQTGTGGQFSDGPATATGGNCYACHQLRPTELSFGTMGPSLLEYGKIRKYAADDAKAAYAKIYNAQSTMPCSNMPRFGHAKFLTEQQIRDLVALLFDPESPVNK